MAFLRTLPRPLGSHSSAGRLPLTVNAYTEGSVPSTVRLSAKKHQQRVQKQQQQQQHVHLGNKQQDDALEHLRLLQRQQSQLHNAVSVLQRPQLQQQHPQEQQQVLPLPLSAGASVATTPAAWQQRQQQRQQVLPHPFCTLEPPALTRRVKSCRSWSDAAVLFAKQSQCMNHINLAALLTHLAHSHCSTGNRPVNWRSFVAQVLAASEPQLNLCSPRQLSNMAWALAKLGFSEWLNPSSSWAQRWQQQVRNTLHGANCRDVSNILWAFATSSSSSSSSRDSCSSRALNSRRQQPLVLQQQERLLCGQLQQELLSALHRTLPDSTPQDVANAFWSCASLQLPLPPDLSQFLLARAQIHFADFKPQEVANIMWAVSELQHQHQQHRFCPPSSWIQELLLRQVGRPQWSEGRAQHHVMCLVACARSKYMPPEKWLAQTLLQLEQLLLLPQQEPQQQHQQEQDIGQQEQQLQQQQQQQQHETDGQPAFGIASSSSSSTMEADFNSSSGSSTADIGSSSLCGSSSSSNTGSNSNSSRWHAQDLANTMWALGSLRITPNPSWTQHFLAASTASLAAATPQELCNTIWGLAKLNIQPDYAWLTVFDAASSAAMRSFTAQALADVLSAQVHLKLQPSGAWQEGWMQALRNVWGSADAAAICKALWAAAKLQLPLGRQWLQQALQQAHVELQVALISQKLSVAELLRLVWAVGRLCRGALTRELSDFLGLCCCRSAGKMSWQQLERGAWGLARLQPLPSQQLIEFFCDLASSKVRYMPAAHAEAVAGKLQLLRDAAEVARMQAAVAGVEADLLAAARMQQQQLYGQRYGQQQQQQRREYRTATRHAGEVQQQQPSATSHSLQQQEGKGKQQQQQQQQQQEQQQGQALLEPEASAAAYSSGAVAAYTRCAVAAAYLQQMRAALAEAQQAVQQAQEYHLQQHRQQLHQRADVAAAAATAAEVRTAERQEGLLQVQGPLSRAQQVLASSSKL